MKNIRKTLEKHGSSVDNVFKCAVLMADVSERPLMNEDYATCFKKGRLPTRNAVGASGLLRGAKMEIECLTITYT
jgi:2-iminobutanoate/2-iminopropanoate deaminase